MVKTVVIGAVNLDINLFIDRFPRKGDEVVVRRVTHVPGGKGGNVAVTAARLLGPSQVAILAGLGQDSIAFDQVKAFKEEGVEVSGLKFNPSFESGHAFIITDSKGENIIYSFPGANATINPGDLDEPTRRGIIADASIVTIMDPPFQTALKLAHDARERGKVVVWDPGVKSRMGVQGVGELLGFVDYIVANEYEMIHLTGTKARHAAPRKLMKTHHALKVVAKLGAKGSVLYYDKQRISSAPLDLKSLGMKAVNTVGCGDAFLGAFVAALAEGRPESEALRWGNCAGGLKATRVETRGSPDRDTLLRYLA